MHFDTIIFYHALYVGFAYSMLAFGATYYRQVVDDLNLQEVSLGEDIASVADTRYLAFCRFIFFCFLYLCGHCIDTIRGKYLPLCDTDCMRYQHNAIAYEGASSAFIDQNTRHHRAPFTD